MAAMIRPSCIVAILAAWPASSNAGTAASESKDGVTLAINRGPAQAVLCLSTKPRVKLSGEYGIHASWSAREASSPGKAVDLHSKHDYFPQPVRVEFPLPQEARFVRVDVGACVGNDYCNPVEFKYDLRRLRPTAMPERDFCKPASSGSRD
jgi:hypothetical protein